MAAGVRDLLGISRLDIAPALLFRVPNEPSINA